MATTYNNKNGGKISIAYVNANDNIVVPGNSSVSNLASNATEVVVSCIVTGVRYGSQGGTWILMRSNASSNVIVGTFNGTGYMPLHDTPLMLSPGNNLKANLESSSNGFLILELHKDTSFT